MAISGINTTGFNVDGIKDYASQIASTKSTTEMSDKVKEAQSDEELMEACKQFETYLWEQVVKSMKSTTNLFGAEEGSSQMVDYFMDTAITNISEHLTEQSMGPNSLAQQMFEQMKRNNTIDVETLLAQSQEAMNTGGTISSDEE